MSPLWTAEALAVAMGGRPVGAQPARIGGISIDSRTLQPGDAFFAIKGETFDGHDFATAAIKAGASLLVVAEGKLPALGRIGAPMIVVPDVLAALEAAGIAARARTRAKVIGVTGSVGKTTAKEALRKALGACGSVHASDKSFNNHWGVPLTLARMPEDCDYAIFEIGMNHPGEIRQLVSFVRPHVAIITAIAAAHLGYFSSLEEIARAKAEIFEGVVPGGHALLNRDDKQWKLLDKAARDAGIEHVWSFGENGRSTFRLASFEADGDASNVVMKMAGQEITFTIGAPGRHIVQNALAVMGAVYLSGADIHKASSALAEFRAERGRGQRTSLKHPSGGEIVVIDESYNANPTSMKAALSLLAAAAVPAGGRRIAVLGDMLELGNHSRKLHEALAGPVAQSQADIVLTAGKEIKALADMLPENVVSQHVEGVDALKPLLLDMVRPGDVVMIKSSNSMGFSRLVEALKQIFAATGDGAAYSNTHV
ncbi:UDP-N-acetylmuramoylalanyl-D-glutamyl-2,6-diaminopimelate--D-alanyl-D-alanine ligase [Mesorhizobium sp. CAU 1741]|uniref:UDP-N-acetylmuramoylalanyl-D-glutamyl-2, 6-diaminopimelate--D-alanyl-D-alanine ligase n=1 Tax=Mesorhizobium sp. CAU 1741 TaxID=3140366 RepID=UPI00325BCCA0